MRAARVDANHSEVKRWYEQLHVQVADCRRVGDGVPDLFVGTLGVTDPVEIKDKQGRLTEAQKKFIARWAGSPVRIVRTLDDVVAHVDDMRRRGRLLIPQLNTLEQDR